MNPLTRSAIVKLRDVHGIRLDAVDDLAVVLKISELADRVQRVQNDHHTEALLHPAVRAGNVVLRRVSIGALDFLKTEVADWFDPDSDDFVYSWAYCHAHVATPEAIWEYRGNRRAWRSRVRQWVRGLDVSEAELLHALTAFEAQQTELDRLIARMRTRRPEDQDDTGHGAIGHIIGALVRTYGHEPIYWAWTAPIEEVEMLLDDFLEEDQRQRQRESGKSGTSDPDRWFVRARRAFQMYLDQLVAERNGGAHGPQ